MTPPEAQHISDHGKDFLSRPAGFLRNHAENRGSCAKPRSNGTRRMNDRTIKRAAGASGGDHGPLNAPAPTLNNKLRMPHTGAHPSAAWPSRQVSFLAPGRAEHNVA